MKTIDKIMLISFILGTLILGAKATAQTFIDEPKDGYKLFQLELDPLGSYDKEGLNTVFTGAVKPKGFPIELGIGIQTLFTTKYVNNDGIEVEDGSFNLDYLDFQGQVQYLHNIGDRFQLLGGMHGGFLWRRDGAGMIWGFIGTSRWFVSKKQRLALVMSGALDYREFREFRFNGRGGLAYLW